MLDIELNGAPYSVPVGYSLQKLAGHLGVTGQAVAVAINREVIPRYQWPERQLRARDQVDIVRAIGGG